MRKLTAISVVLFSTVSATAAFAEDPTEAPAAGDAPAAGEAAPAASTASEAPASKSSESTAASSGDAASPQAQQGAVSVAALLGNGFKDGYNIGLGARAGYTIDHGLYLGGTFIYHLGKSEGPYTFKILLVGGEVGYTLDAGPVIVRPNVGVGLASAKASGGGLSASDNKLFIAPGVTGLYPIGSAFVGVDARYTLVSDYNAFELFLTGGVSF